MEKKVQIKRGILFAEKDGDLYALDVVTGRIHSFNRTAKAVVQICMEPRTFEEIVNEYIRYFDLTFAQGKQDVTFVLDRLRKQDLLQEINEGQAG